MNFENFRYIVIPSNVRFDTRLPPNSKLLYGEIAAQCSETGSCIFDWKYFAHLYKVDQSTVQRWLRALIKCKYVECEKCYTQIQKSTGKCVVEGRLLKVPRSILQYRG